MKCWFSYAETAALKLPGLPASERGVRMLADRSGWIVRPRSGVGGGVEAHLDNWPAQARAEYVGREAALNRQTLDGLARGVAPEVALRDARRAVLDLVERFATLATVSRKRADALFCDEWNLGRVAAPDGLKEEVKTLTPRTLRRWRQALRAGRADLTCDRAVRKSVLELASDGEVKTYILALVAKQPQLTAHHVRALVADRFGGMLTLSTQLRRPAGGTIPSAQGEARRADPTTGEPPVGSAPTLRTVPVPPVRTFQHTLKAWRHSYRNELESIRDPDGFRSRTRFAGVVAQPAMRLNEVWQIDASPADVMLTDGRYSLYVCEDIYSRRLIALVTKTPRAAAVALTVRKAMIAWGVPERIKTDNGSDFVARDTQRLLKALGIEHETAAPFQPQQKGHVERAIGTLQRDLMRTLPGFIGHSVAERKVIEGRKSFAQRLGEQPEDTFAVALTAADLQACVDAWCGDVYAHRSHDGLKRRTPFTVAAGYPGAVRRIEDVRALDMMLAPVAGKDGLRTATKTGLRIDGAYYIAGWLNVGDTVLCRMDPADLGRAHVFSTDGLSYLGEAIAPDLAGVDPAAAIAAARAAQKALIDGRMADVKREARKIKAKDFAPSIHRQALADAGKLIAFPRPTEAHDTPALAAARRAGVVDDEPQHAADVVALAARLAAEQRDVSNVTALRVEETAHHRWHRARGLEQALADGVSVSSDDLMWLGAYRQGPEYRGFALTYGAVETKSPAGAGQV